MQRPKTRGAGQFVLAVSGTVAAFAALRLLAKCGEHAGPSAGIGHEEVVVPAAELEMNGLPASGGRFLRPVNRMAVMRALLALSVLLVAADVGLLAVPVTFGGFTTQTKNPANSLSAGTLQVTTNRPGTFIFQLSNALPGVAQTGTVIVTNSGTLPAAAMRLGLSSLVDNTCQTNRGGCVSPVGTGILSSQATLAVVDNTHLTGGNPTTVIPSGTIATGFSGGTPTGTYTLVGNGAGGTWLVGEAHTLVFTLTVPLSALDAYQGASSTFTVSFTGAS
jgi:hypothetical protein